MCQQIKRRHRGAGNPVTHNTFQILIGRSFANWCRFELVDAHPIITWIGIEEGSCWPRSIPTDSMTMSTMTAIKSPGLPPLVPAHWSCRHHQIFLIHKIGQSYTGIRPNIRFIRCPKNRSQHIGQVFQLVFRERHFRIIVLPYMYHVEVEIRTAVLTP